MLRYRQSSLWLLNSGINIRRYSYLARGICFKASDSLARIASISCGVVSFWGQTGVCRLASRTPRQCVGVTGGMNLRPPVGGVAYGTPRYVSISGSSSVVVVYGVRRFNLTTEPLNEPYLVLMVRVDRVADSAANVCIRYDVVDKVSVRLEADDGTRYASINAEAISTLSIVLCNL